MHRNRAEGEIKPAVEVQEKRIGKPPAQIEILGTWGGLMSRILRRLFGLECIKKETGVHPVSRDSNFLNYGSGLSLKNFLGARPGST